MLTGRLFDAAEADRMGLLNKLVPHDALMNEATTLAEKFAKGPGRSYAMIKSALNNWPATLSTLMEIEANMQAICFETHDLQEGINAFMEKRKPDFTGE